MNKLAVFLTVYDRFENLDKTINLFRNQKRSDFDLYIVNNSDRKIDDLVDFNCEIINMHNKYNIYGRFFAVRDVIDKGYEVIGFMDDDIVFASDYTKECYLQYDPRYVKSFWAFEVADDYWVRKKLHADRRGHYAGAGGLLAPIDFFRVPQLYECPEEYWIVDDIWMSHVVLKYTKYEIRAFKLPVMFMDDNKATYKRIRQKKSDIAKELILPYK
jgi:glycosyltransferase involved in cell wall biosynthesis